MKREPQEIPDADHELVIERVCAIDVAKASGAVCVGGRWSRFAVCAGGRFRELFACGWLGWWRDGDSGGGEHPQVEPPGALGSMVPQVESLVNVVFGGGGGHAGDRLEVGEGLPGVAADFGEAVVGDAVAVAAHTDQPAQRLNAAVIVVVPPFVCFQPAPHRPALTPSAQFAALHGPPGDHPAESFPVLWRHAGADVGEPARGGQTCSADTESSAATSGTEYVGTPAARLASALRNATSRNAPRIPCATSCSSGTSRCLRPAVS